MVKGREGGTYAARVVLDPDGIFAGVGTELSRDGGGYGVGWDVAEAGAEFKWDIGAVWEEGGIKIVTR
jgi:hypothetical protein